MDPNKRGNPPFEPSSYAAGLERRIKREVDWRRDAVAQVRMLLYGDAVERYCAEQWWHERLTQPEVVLSNGAPE